MTNAQSTYTKSPYSEKTVNVNSGSCLLLLPLVTSLQKCLLVICTVES